MLRTDWPVASEERTSASHLLEDGENLHSLFIFLYCTVPDAKGFEERKRRVSRKAWLCALGGNVSGKLCERGTRFNWWEWRKIMGNEVGG